MAHPLDRLFATPTHHLVLQKQRTDPEVTLVQADQPREVPQAFAVEMSVEDAEAQEIPLWYFRGRKGRG